MDRGLKGWFLIERWEYLVSYYKAESIILLFEERDEYICNY